MIRYTVYPIAASKEMDIVTLETLSGVVNTHTPRHRYKKIGLPSFGTTPRSNFDLWNFFYNHVLNEKAAKLAKLHLREE
ncbi:MAG: hypothetical protein ABI325_02495 [Ginsengibacter sp.]